MPNKQITELLATYAESIENRTISDESLRELLNNRAFNPSVDQSGFQAISEHESLMLAREFVPEIASKLRPEDLHRLVERMLALEDKTRGPNVLARLFLVLETVRYPLFADTHNYSRSAANSQSLGFENIPLPLDLVSVADPEPVSSASAAPSSMFPWQPGYKLFNMTKGILAEALSSKWFGHAEPVTTKPVTSISAPTEHSAVNPFNSDYKKGNIIEALLGKSARIVVFGNTKEETREPCEATKILIGKYARKLQDERISDKELQSLLDDGMNDQSVLGTIEFVQMIAPTLTRTILHRLVERMLVLEPTVNPLAFIGNIEQSIAILFLAYETARNPELAQSHYYTDQLMIVMTQDKAWKSNVMDNYAIPLIKKNQELFDEDRGYSQLLHQIKSRVHMANQSEIPASYLPLINTFIDYVQMQKTLGTVNTMQLITLLSEVDAMMQSDTFATERHDIDAAENEGLAIRVIKTVEAIIPHELSPVAILMKMKHDLTEKMMMEPVIEPVEAFSYNKEHKASAGHTLFSSPIVADVEEIKEETIERDVVPKATVKITP